LGYFISFQYFSFFSYVSNLNLSRYHIFLILVAFILGRIIIMEYLSFISSYFYSLLLIFLVLHLWIQDFISLVYFHASFFLKFYVIFGWLKATEEEVKQTDNFRSPLYREITVKGVSMKIKWCSTCQFYRPPRSSHCSICNKCIVVWFVFVLNHWSYS